MKTFLILSLFLGISFAQANSVNDLKCSGSISVVGANSTELRPIFFTNPHGVKINSVYIPHALVSCNGKDYQLPVMLMGFLGTQQIRVKMDFFKSFLSEDYPIFLSRSFIQNNELLMQGFSGQALNGSMKNFVIHKVTTSNSPEDNWVPLAAFTGNPDDMNIGVIPVKRANIELQTRYSKNVGSGTSYQDTLIVDQKEQLELIGTNW